MALDLVAGPAVLLLGGASAETEVVAVREAGASPSVQRTEKEPPSTVARFVTGARLHFGMRSSVRTFVGIDGALGPSAGGAPPDQLPVATLGLSLGATVGAR